MTNKDTKKVLSVDSVFLWITFIVLFILKLDPGGHLTTAVVTWSWWIVFMPLWIMPVIMIIVFIIAFISFIFLGLFGTKDE